MARFRYLRPHSVMAIASDLGCALHSATYIRCQTQNVMGSFCEILLSDSMLGRPFDCTDAKSKTLGQQYRPIAWLAASRLLCPVFKMIECDVRYWYLTDIPGDLLDDGGIR